MPVNIDPDGRRWISAEVIVPGTPEEVWHAIATGPGVTSWFVPTEVRDDGTVVSHFGPGFDVVATPLYSEPPHRFAGEGDMVPGGPKMATEWTVKALSGGKCTVRVVHSFFASTDDWDDQLQGFESGWADYFRILTLYLTHFRGQSCTPMHAMAMSTEPITSAWGKLIAALGLLDGNAGENRSSSQPTPNMAGQIDRAASKGHPHQFIIHLDQPGAGLAHVFAMSAGPIVMLVVRIYLYGPLAASIVEREAEIWQTWMGTLFPPPTTMG